VTELKANNNRFTPLELFAQFSIRKSWDLIEFKDTFGVTVKEAFDSTDIFCIAGFRIHLYQDTTREEMEKFLHFINERFDNH